jgi:hypothetical protein
MLPSRPSLSSARNLHEQVATWAKRRDVQRQQLHLIAETTLEHPQRDHDALFWPVERASAQEHSQQGNCRSTVRSFTDQLPRCEFLSGALVYCCCADREHAVAKPPALCRRLAGACHDYQTVAALKALAAEYEGTALVLITVNKRRELGH